MSAPRRELLLVRHAKSSWDDDSVADHDRALAPRGVATLPRLSEHLARRPRRPELVLCSTSRRTLDTLAGVRGALPDDVHVAVESRIYGASARTMLARLHDVDDRVRCAMVLGHNPGLQDLALLLAGAGSPVLREQLTVKFPTAAVAQLSFVGRWSDLGPADASLDDLFLPRRRR